MSLGDDRVGHRAGEFHKVHRFAVVERHLYRDMG